VSIKEMRSGFANISVHRASHLLGLQRSEYYRWPITCERRSEKALKDEALLKDIRSIIEEIPGYGYRRVTVELQHRGNEVNHKKIMELMNKNGLQRKKKKAFIPQTTDSDHDHPVYPNLVKNIEVTRPNQVWVADITYIQLEKGFCYLAAILDLYLRKCIGHNISMRLDTDLALDALKMAYSNRSGQDLIGLIHHSDRGVQYASDKYTEYLKEHGIQISMSRTGNPYDNAFMESFFKTLKVEEVYLNEYLDIMDAWENIEHFIEDVYNLKRLHSSLGYKSPVDFEKEVTLNSVA
jgi:putative transposase